MSNSGHCFGNCAHDLPHTVLKVTVRPSAPSTLQSHPCSAGRWKGLYWEGFDAFGMSLNLDPPKGENELRRRKKKGNKRALPICPAAFNGELFKRYNRGLCVPAEICSGQLLQGAQTGWCGVPALPQHPQKEITVGFLFFVLIFFLLQKVYALHTLCSCTKATQAEN